MDESERLARLICQALHANVSPDDTVSMAGGVDVPLWVIYQPAARAIMEDEERRAEGPVSVRRIYPEEIE